MRACWYLSDTHACGIVRADVPARAIGQYHRDIGLCCKRDFLLSDLFLFDLFIMQRGSREEDLRRMQMAAGRGIKTIYDLDDDLFNVPAHVKAAHDYFSLPKPREMMSEMLNTANVVTVSNTACAEVAAKHTKSPIVIVGNCIDWGHAKLAKPRVADDRIVIGWVGSEVHRPDAALIDSALIKIMEKHDNVDIRIIGNFEPKDFSPELVEFGARFHLEGWAEPNSLYATIAQFDISLCAVTPGKFNDAKSEIKWMEAGSVGVPCVVSPVRPYEKMADGHDCVKAVGNSEAGWFDAIESLVSDPAKRRCIGEAARERVSREYDSRVVAREWVNAFRIAERM